MTKSFKIAILLALHNRVEKTKKCIDTFLQELPENWTVRFYVVNDGSTDATSSYLNSLKEKIKLKVVEGPGTWYWAKSMRQAELAIEWDFDAILWLNNDVEFIRGQLAKVEKIRKQFPKSILVGQFCDPKNLIGTYGGYWRVSRNPLKFKQDFLFDVISTSDSFNGNFVLVPSSCAELIGGIDGGYAHAYADCDYGLRAKKLGIDIRVIPDFLGFCERNMAYMPPTVLKKLMMQHQTKRNPFRSQVRFFRRHGGIEWPIYLFTPYLRIFTKHYLDSLRTKFQVK